VRRDGRLGDRRGLLVRQPGRREELGVPGGVAGGVVVDAGQRQHLDRRQGARPVAGVDHRHRHLGPAHEPLDHRRLAVGEARHHRRRQLVRLVDPGATERGAATGGLDHQRQAQVADQAVQHGAGTELAERRVRQPRPTSAWTAARARRAPWRSAWPRRSGRLPAGIRRTGRRPRRAPRAERRPRRRRRAARRRRRRSRCRPVRRAATRRRRAGRPGPLRPGARRAPSARTGGRRRARATARRPAPGSEAGQPPRRAPERPSARPDSREVRRG
jgi:hypothetical protein